MQLAADPAQLDALLLSWVNRQWLRDLDRALVGFCADQIKEADTLSLLSLALVSHQLGRGHICLPLAQALADPDDTLSLPPEGDGTDLPPPRPSELLEGLTLAHWRSTLLASPLVDSGPGERPLVLDGDRLYLRRYWQYEQQVAAGIRQRIDTRLSIPAGLAGALEAQFNQRTPEEQARRQVHWQTIAAALACRSAFTVISGGPGTGKTTTVVRLLGLLQVLALEEAGAQPLAIRLAAPTGKAAARLSESIAAAVSQLQPASIRAHVPSEVTTLHRLLRPLPNSRRFRHHAGNPRHLDVLVVDEASMVDLEMMAALLEALPPRARLILLGDKDQLASVEAGAVLGELCREADLPGYSAELVDWLGEQSGYDLSAWQGQRSNMADHIALLRTSHRFDAGSGIGQLARAVNAGEKRQAERLWQGGSRDIGRVDLKARPEALPHLILGGDCGQFPDGYRQRSTSAGQPVPLPLGYQHYLQVLHHQRPTTADSEPRNAWVLAVLAAFGQFRLLTALRKGPWGVEGLNLQVEKVLQQAQLLPALPQAWYEGRPVLVTRNDYGLSLMNGDIGIALCDPSDDGRLRVFFPDGGGGVRAVLPSRLAHVETVFAMTVHKSQGSEFTHTALILPDRINPVLTRELVYTGITRARDWFTLAGPQLWLLDKAIERQIRRASGLGDRLQDVLSDVLPDVLSD